MDTLTQAVLGATVTVAVMHRRTAVWKAAAWGAVAGTLPDLDVLIDHGDPILNMLRHRAESHSLFWLSLVSLPLALAVARLHNDQAIWKRWWLALWLALFTHPLLDVLTMYGTRLALPFSDRPFSIGSVFFVDPLVTVPWLAGLLAALAVRGSARGLALNRLGLMLGVLYLGWSVGAQQLVSQWARASLQEQGITAERVLVTPTPFNTLLWRVVAVAGPVHHEGFVSVLDEPGPIRFVAFDRGRQWLPKIEQHPTAQELRAFTQGYYKLHVQDDQLVISDLRIAQEPEYEFAFAVADLGHSPRLLVPSAAVKPSMDNLDEALAWLWQRMWGADVALSSSDKRSRLNSREGEERFQAEAGLKLAGRTSLGPPDAGTDLLRDSPPRSSLSGLPGVGQIRTVKST